MYTSFVIDRLRWIPWDRGKMEVSCAHHSLSCDTVPVQNILSTSFSYSITIKKVWLYKGEYEHNRFFLENFSKRAFPISCFGKSVFRLSCFRKARYATVLLERLFAEVRVDVCCHETRKGNGRKSVEVCD